MDAYLFICLGTRDVQIKSGVELDEKIKVGLEQCKYPLDNKNFRDLKVRKFGHLLNNNFELIKKKIEIPLMEPLFKYMEKESHNIRKIYLIATDQSETVNEDAKEHLDRDTCTIAQFLKDKYFHYYFKSKHKTMPGIDIIILKNTPNNYDLMIKEFGDNLREINESQNDLYKNNNYIIYAEITGGTPQINTSVILNCTKVYKDKVIFIYKSENSKSMQSLNVTGYILNSYEHETLKQLVERYDFDAIARNKFYSESIRGLAKCACYRLNFDFSNYKEEIVKYFNCISDKMGLDILKEDAFKLFQKEPNKLFNELYWNTVIMWQRDECANFIGRVWRIMEASLQYSLLKIIGCEWDEMIEERDNEKGTFIKKFEMWTDDDENEFVDYLEAHKKTYKLSHIKKPTSPNMPILHACIDFLAQRQDKYKNIQVWTKKLKPFSDMRNKSIIAHGFADISKEKIINTLKDGDDILFVIRSLIESVGIRLSEENPFDIIKNIIIEINEQKLSESLNV